MRNRSRSGVNTSGVNKKTRICRNDVDRVVPGDFCVYNSANRQQADSELLACGCSHNCSIYDECPQGHHDKFFGQSKSVVVGIVGPIQIQSTLRQILAQNRKVEKVVTIIVDASDEDTLRGELLTLQEIDKLDPNGIFTAKMLYHQIVRPVRGQQDALQRVITQCREENTKTACTYKIDEDSPHMLLLHQLEEWHHEKRTLHYIYMEFAGKDVESFKHSVVSPANLYLVCSQLLTNYAKLSEHRICHLDLHDSNVTWHTDSSDGSLKFKLIDFGYNKVFDRSEKSSKCCENCRAVDVTSQFMRICELSVDGLRAWHPVAYPMFHICASLLLAPMLLPASAQGCKRWNRQMHLDKLQQMRTFHFETTQHEMLDFGHTNDAFAQFWGVCPMEHEHATGSQQACSRAKYGSDLHVIWGKLPITYAAVARHLLPTWYRVCDIVGAEIAQCQFNRDDGELLSNTRLCNPEVLCLGGDALVECDTYVHVFDVFRTRFYHCQELDLATVQREFDTFSLAIMLLNMIPRCDTHMREIVHTHLLQSHDFQTDTTKLYTAAHALRPS